MKERIALVVPSIREDSFVAFVDRWRDVGLFDHCHLILMEDNPDKTFPIPTGLNVLRLCWQDIEDGLTSRGWIIPRRSDTVRSFAYWRAWQAGYTHILTLDDDCYPCTLENDGVEYNGRGFLDAHLKALESGDRWFNTLNKVKPRGIPFYNKGKDDGSGIINHGLWTNVLDYDAPYQLANPIKEEFSYDNRVVPNGKYFPMCGMNVMWKAEATPLMYHLLMGKMVSADLGSFDYVDESDLEKLPFDRFGDIWCGIFMKKIADTCGLQVTTGMPYIRHERASNPFTNLKKEANGIEVNEKLWEYVDHWSPATGGGNSHLGLPIVERFALMYKDLGGYISLYNDYPEHRTYFQKLGQAMQLWGNLFLKDGGLLK